jgi:hypothetical protein
MPLDNENKQEDVDNDDIPEYRPGGEADDLPNAGGSDAEDQARALGWVPEDEYTGNPGKWADAETFLEVHSKNNGALRKAVAAQAKDLQELKNQMRGMDSAHKKIFEIQIKKQKEEFDQQVAFLKAQKREALRSGEHETAADIDEQLDGLRERGPDLPELPDTTPKGVAPQEWRTNADMVAWAKHNPWFDKDEDMTLLAGGLGQSIRRANPNMPFTELLEEVSVKVRKAFPHKFAGARRSPVEGGTPGETQAVRTGKSYESLPRDAKAACDEAVSDGGLTRKQWVELYYGYDDRRKK